ncbi:sugar ABC transporter ATP-binding protein [Serinibacter arcticus]|uniref:Sugar ABC transporter ATP-binding protein n=1 Tax=Serinibacter arcticus TaxID=1655435 RepID=A0A2U1ZTQ8_9MICO|nr:ATP-binding cassette domain-containing protein [Serinibacter arcticus]PWD50368.1 sugar ABC transporter ATP-binding protein [Serinibacter arcticus]
MTQHAAVDPRENPLLRLESIEKNFGAVEALVGASLTVHAHEVVAIVGDNAAGKSTLAKIVAGVLQPDSGLIEIEGEQVAIPSPSAAQQLGVATVFQDLAVANNLDVTANLFLGREQRKRGSFLLDEGEMDLAARRILTDLGARIPSIRTRLGELSGGQRQAVAIARTLIGNPRIVVLDEPTASLSVAQTAEVLNHIEKLRELGLGVIFISHNLNDVRAIADRIEVLRHGRNNGSFLGREATNEDLIAAITGAFRSGDALEGYRRG